MVPGDILRFCRCGNKGLIAGMSNSLWLPRPSTLSGSTHHTALSQNIRWPNNLKTCSLYWPQADIKSLLGTDNVDHLPPILTHDPRVYSKELTEEDEAKEEESWSSPHSHNIRLLQALSPRDVKILIQAEEELSQTKVSKYFAITVAKYFAHSVLI